MIYKTEDIGGIKVCISSEHTFGIDAFLLSGFSSPKNSDLICDLCTGCGIVPLLWLRNKPLKNRVSAVDIQTGAIRQLSKTVRINALAEKIAPIHADLRELKGVLPGGRFDLVTVNPPYFADGAGIISRDKSDGIARHETLCTFEDCCLAAARLLRYGGRFCLCHPPGRLTDALLIMRNHKLEPKRMRFVQKDKESAPWLVLIEGKRGSKPFLKVEPPLLLYENGEASKEMHQLYY